MLKECFVEINNACKAMYKSTVYLLKGLSPREQRRREVVWDQAIAEAGRAYERVDTAYRATRYHMDYDFMFDLPPRLLPKPKKIERKLPEWF